MIFDPSRRAAEKMSPASITLKSRRLPRDRNRQERIRDTSIRLARGGEYRSLLVFAVNTARQRDVALAAG